MNKQGILDTLQQAINAVEDARPNAALDCLQQIKALLDAPKGSVAIAFTMKTEDVPALLVAINKHAHAFLVDAQRSRQSIEKGKKAGLSTTAIRVMEEDARLWSRKGDVLNSLKINIKQQAGIK